MTLWRKQMLTEYRRAVNEKRRNKTRDNLLSSASTVFQKQGYHGTHVSDVVAHAGVGQGSFYRHFSSKRDLFDELFDSVMLQILSEIAGIAESLPENLQEYREASIRVVAGAARILKANRGLVQLFINDGPSVDREFREKFENMFLQIAAMAREYLEHAMSLGFARPCHTYIVSQMLVGAGLRIVNEYFAGRIDDIGIDGAIREAIEFAFEGMQA